MLQTPLCSLLIIGLRGCGVVCCWGTTLVLLFDAVGAVCWLSHSVRTSVGPLPNRLIQPIVNHISTLDLLPGVLTAVASPNIIMPSVHCPSPQCTERIEDGMTDSNFECPRRPRRVCPAVAPYPFSCHTKLFFKRCVHSGWHSHVCFTQSFRR